MAMADDGKWQASPVYLRMVERNIALLKIKCTSGVYSERLFRTVGNGDGRLYTLDRIGWMKDFLSDPNEHIAAGCLDCLCRHGYDLAEATGVISSRLGDRMFSSKVIEIAERENRPDVLLMFMEEKDAYINRVIIALKKTGNESYLTTLMLSENEDLVRAIDRMTK